MCLWRAFVSYNLLLYWSNLGKSKILFHNCVASDIHIIKKLSSCVSDKHWCRTSLHNNNSTPHRGLETTIMAAMCTCGAISIFLLGKKISFMSVSNYATLFSRPQYAIVIKIFYSGMCTQLCKNNLLLYWSNLGKS